jgi:light-regulated signal transduction histidine kinase (bacteriophytochrome)
LLSLFAFIDYEEIKNKETLELLKHIEIGAKGVKSSLDNYLDIISNNGFGKVVLEEVVLDDSLCVAVNSIGSLIQNSSATISSDFSSFHSVYFNKVFTQSIFLNLITNEIKYAKPGVSPILTLFSSIEDGQKA